MRAVAASALILILSTGTADRVRAQGDVHAPGVAAQASGTGDPAAESASPSTALPGTLWDNNDFNPGGAGAAFTATEERNGGFNTSVISTDDFFLDPADLAAAVDPANPASCPVFQITEIRARMFPSTGVEDRPWLLLIYDEDPVVQEPVPDDALDATDEIPAPVVGPLPTNTEDLISVVPSVVDAIWDLSATPITLDAGPYWLMPYKDVTDRGASLTGWWSPNPSTDQRAVGKIGLGGLPWDDRRDMDFDIDGGIVDPCAGGAVGGFGVGAVTIGAAASPNAVAAPRDRSPLPWMAGIGALALGAAMWLRRTRDLP